MHAQPTPPPAAAPTGHPTAQAERDADQALAQIAAARQQGDTPDDTTAAAAWAEIARLAALLQRRAREIHLVASAQSRDDGEVAR